MLKSDFTGNVMIFAKEYQERTFYSMGLSKKKQDGTYENGYINVKFKKDVVVPNKAKITIQKAWLDFYLKDKITVPQIFISEFEMEEQIPEGFATMDETDSDIPF